jgi:hypothetical protein
MTVKTMDPIGVPVSTFPPPRFRTRRFTFWSFSSSARVIMTTLDRPQPVEGGHDQRAALMDGFECFVELGAPGVGTADPVIDREVIPADAGGQKVRDLPIRALG